MKTWPRCSSPCRELSIRYYKHAVNRTPTKTLSVTDDATIQSMLQVLEQVPVSGGEYVSFSDEVERLVIHYTTSENEPFSVEFFGKQIKTLDTTILGDDPSVQRLYQLATEALSAKPKTSEASNKKHRQ